MYIPRSHNIPDYRMEYECYYITEDSKGNKHLKTERTASPFKDADYYLESFLNNPENLKLLDKGNQNYYCGNSLYTYQKIRKDVFKHDFYIKYDWKREVVSPAERLEFLATVLDMYLKERDAKKCKEFYNTEYKQMLERNGAFDELKKHENDKVTMEGLECFCTKTCGQIVRDIYDLVLETSKDKNTEFKLSSSQQYHLIEKMNNFHSLAVTEPLETYCYDLKANSVGLKEVFSEEYKEALRDEAKNYVKYTKGIISGEKKKEKTSPAARTQ